MGILGAGRWRPPLPQEESLKPRVTAPQEPWRDSGQTWAPSFFWLTRVPPRTLPMWSV